MAHLSRTHVRKRVDVTLDPAILLQHCAVIRISALHSRHGHGRGIKEIVLELPINTLP
ncbi:hypothetical protein SCHPADRAFT_907515 [Schizopora paradoxa]|uniref:Uncharacterized protein n=1 Tax=Schizopora paradoxa TaxID=27342 RepID=A0A0H2RD77_9AGAM|nr:hypothetical protein SCHPADRAFT_907515 [Schizopora paradoxa]